MFSVRAALDEDRKDDFEGSDPVEAINDFSKMGLKELLLRGIYSYGAATRRRLLRKDTF